MTLSRAAALGLLAAMTAAPLAAAPDRGEPEPGPHPRFVISVSYVANLVHWVDNLAGSSGGKTVRTYRRYWQQRFGPPTPEELKLLRGWGALRMHPDPSPGTEPVNPGGCLPQVEEVPGRRQRFLLASYDAPTIPAFLEALGSTLEPAEVARVGRVLAAFEPRFRKVWEEVSYLHRFEERFRRFLRESELRPLLGRVARFLEVDPSEAPPGRIHLMALPQESATFATAIGRDLMMEIRPGDGPSEQVQVIAHETTHYFWQLIPPARRDRIAATVHAASPQGPVAWALLREGLPTAVGQGLADARLVPERFGMEFTWYHIATVDRFAKSIYPMVEEAIRTGKSFERDVAPRIGRGESALAGEAAPSRYVEESMHLLGEGTLRAYSRILKRIPIRHRWVYPASSPEVAGFLERYACLGGLALVGPGEAADPSRLPALLRQALAPGPEGPGGDGPVEGDAGRADGRPTPGALRSGVHVVRRPGGGLLFILVAAQEEDLIPVADLFLRLERPPERPAWLHPEPSRP